MKNKQLKYLIIFFVITLIIVSICIILKKGESYTTNPPIKNIKEIDVNYVGKPSSTDYDFCDKSKDPINWPPNDGCLDSNEPLTVKAGSYIDRYGGTGGYFVSPYGYSYNQRSLPYISSEPVCANYYNEVYNVNNPNENYHIYKVNKDFDVSACKVAPYFGAEGGAIQYKYSKPLNELLQDNSIEEVKKDDIFPFFS